MNLIELHDITKTYQLDGIQVPVLRGVSLGVAEGEFVALMGVSGSGKTTLMNILGCLDRPSSGEYWLNGQDVTALTPDQRAGLRNREIGFVFQNFNLLPRSSAAGNVELPLVYAGVPRRERVRRARAALEAVGLGDRMGHRPMELSGGQRQRVAIARALINNPSIIFADEPTGNLDTHSGESILAILDELHGQGHTIVMVTHEPEVASRAQRVVSFRDGKIVSDTWQTPQKPA